jgi:hypothetical protein
MYTLNVLLYDVVTLMKEGVHGTQPQPLQTSSSFLAYAMISCLHNGSSPSPGAWRPRSCAPACTAFPRQWCSVKRCRLPQHVVVNGFKMGPHAALRAGGGGVCHRIHGWNATTLWISTIRFISSNVPMLRTHMKKGKGDCSFLCVTDIWQVLHNLMSKILMTYKEKIISA